MYFRIVEAEDERGPYKVETADYLYSLADTDQREIIAYHWHPHEEGPHHTPHMRLGYGARVQFEGLSDINLPSGRVALEQIIRLAIELGAKPQRDDWDALLQKGQTAFEQWRTWA